MADPEIPATATNAVDAAPKVFISHAGEDRERFAKPFAARLRANGVDAWASFWEINPGDSIVDKIFNEGLKNCEAIVIVLSNNSIDKPWVREELNAGMVRKIEKGSKLIPIRLDGCEVPECLKHTCWQEILDLRNFDKEFERILNAVFGMYDKPPIGERPAYVRPDVLKIGDLTRIDSVIFEVACRTALEQDNPLIAAEPLVAALKAKGISETQIMETQEVLDSRRYIKLYRAFGSPHAYSFSVEPFGFLQFVQVAFPDFGKICADVAGMLVRSESFSHRSIARDLNQPVFLIEHVFRAFASNGLIKYAESVGGGLHMDVCWVSPELRRKLEETN